MAQPKPKPEETLAEYVRIQQAADKEILRALRDAYKDVNAQLARMSRAGANDLDRARALAIKQAILEAQADLFDRTGQIVQKRRVQAAARAIQVAGRYDEAAFAAVGRERDARALAEGLEATEARAIDAIEARISGASYVPLSQRVYRTRDWSSGTIDRRINSALARGLNAQEFAREIQKYINPNTPGGPRYAALRLARTEINNAYHAMAVRAAQMKPWVKKVEWHLSKSHPKRPGGPEKCELLVGFHTPDAVPLKPHPQCMCYITPVVDDDDDAFLDALVDGEYDEFLDTFAQQHDLGETGPDDAFGGTQAVRAGTPEAPVIADTTPELPEAIQPGGPRRGRDMVEEIIASIERHHIPGEFMMADSSEHDKYLNAMDTMGRPVDAVLTQIARDQGYGLPQLGDSADVDRAVFLGGYQEGWRGAQNHRSSTAWAQMDELRESEDFQLGTGIYGNGMYVSDTQEVANQFAGRTPGVKPIGRGKGTTVRMAISPVARFAEWHEFRERHQKFLEELRGRGVHAQTVMLFHDPSIYAAALGYDGIHIPDQPDGAYIQGQADDRLQWSIFNREVLVIERENR